jgi:hypothetical protein
LSICAGVHPGGKVELAEDDGVVPAEKTGIPPKGSAAWIFPTRPGIPGMAATQRNATTSDTKNK